MATVGFFSSLVIVLLACVVQCIIGYVWYAKNIFGNAFYSYNGLKRSDFIIGSGILTKIMISLLIRTIVLYYFVLYSIPFGIIIGLIIFIVLLDFERTMWIGRSTALVLINAGIITINVLVSYWFMSYLLRMFS